MTSQKLFTALFISGSLLWATTLQGQTGTASAAERGQALYTRHCAVCHGSAGEGDTPVGRLLRAPPPSFADPVTMARVTFDRMYQAIKQGRPGTAMAAWEGVLTEIEIGELIEFSMSLTGPRPPGMTDEQLSLAIGRRFYEQNCSVCHGEGGRADTAAAKVLEPPPRNFTDPIAMARVDDARMYTAIKLGSSGTAMASWESHLGPAEILDLMRYLRSFEQPLPAGMTQTELDLAVGGQIYAEDCALCHGGTGNAQTPLSLALSPRPRDFTNAQVMASLPDEYLATIIRDGKPGTSMAPWRGILHADDVRRVILFIRQVLQKG